MNAVRLTTNLSPQLMSFITSQAKKLHKTKRDILESAIALYEKEVRRKQLLQGYNQMGDDQVEMNEWLEIANNSSNLQV